MSVPQEVREVERPKNSVVIDRGGNGLYRWAVIVRTGCRRVNGMNQPVSGGTIGHIIEGRYVPVDKESVSMCEIQLKGYADVVLIDRLNKDLLAELCAIYELKDARRLYVMAVLKVANPGITYEAMARRYEMSFISELYGGVALSKNTICTFLKNLGNAYSKISTFMRNRVAALAIDHKVIIDGTLKSDTSIVNTLSHFSRKARIKGTKDFSVLYAYSADILEPVCCKVYGGNVIDSVAYENFLNTLF